MLFFVAIVLFQVSPKDFTSYGVTGLLGFAFLVVIGLVYNLVTKQVSKQIEANAAQNKAFMDFMGAHRTEFANLSNTSRAEFTKALEQISEKLATSVRESNSELTRAFNRQSTLFDRVFLTRGFVDEIKSLYVEGQKVDTEAIERAIEKVLSRHKLSDLDNTRV